MNYDTSPRAVPNHCQHIIDMFNWAGNAALVSGDLEMFADLFDQEARYERLQCCGRDCQPGVETALVRE